MQAQAAALLDGLDPAAPEAAVSLFREDWHHGVVGILAARVKDRLHRPVAAFAPDADGEHIKGSVRSIPGVHVRDLLDTVAARNPGLVERFGGHAMAAGLTIRRGMFDRFSVEFAAEADRVMPAEMREAVVLSDGEIPAPTSTSTSPARSATPPPGAGVSRAGLRRDLRRGRGALRGRRAACEAQAPPARRRPPGRRDRVQPRAAAPANARGEVQVAYRLVVNAFRGEERPELIVEEIGAAP